ncbi:MULTISPECIES: hypothetical protein [unclassified Streptomyces]|uniref:hypothetical protein n=1 Tax=unclassified Streptomyces TaxID=2593676 RepID=UPI0011CDF87E|nr:MULTISPECIES: hypothetical protein [Streptomyces]QHC31662.1 hypothetical protein GR129_25570 [Streptomyces sp. HF10]TXJ82990.1 hypothetical protein E2C11_08050 [Streptomyces lavendulae]
MKLSLEDAVSIFRDLEEYVISFDRIISRIGSGADPVIFIEYLAAREVPARLARVRELLGDELEALVGEEALEAIAEDVFRYSDGDLT